MQDIDELLALPDVASDPDRLSKLAKERSDLTPVVHAFRELQAARTELGDARVLAGDDDAEIAAMAREEVTHVQQRLAELEEQMRSALLPKDPNDDQRHPPNRIPNGKTSDRKTLHAPDSPSFREVSVTVCTKRSSRLILG